MNEPTIPQEVAEKPIPVEVQTLARTAPVFLEHIRVIESGDDMALAMRELAEIKISLGQFKPARKEFLRPAQEALDAYAKKFDDAANPIIAKLERAKRGWESGIVAYRERERTRVAEENRRRQELVDQEQAAARARSAAIAAKAAQEAAEKRRKAEEAKAAGRAAQAAKLRSQAESVVEAAEIKVADIQSVAATIVAPVAEPDVPKSDAGHFSSRSSGRVRSLKEMRDVEKAAVGEKGVGLLCASVEADLQKRKQELGLIPLICAIADGVRVGSAFPPPLLLKIDQKQMNDLARSLGSRFDMIPGCALETETSVVSKRK